MKTVKRRRKECKTDYSKRLKLLKSEKPRAVLRRTNKYFIAQYVLSKEAEDKVQFGVTSKVLLKYGWPEAAKGSLKSLPATYLTGYLFGKEVLKKKLEAPVMDLGMARILHKSRIYGFLKGLKDSGVELKCDEENFPEENRIAGEHMKNKIPFNEIMQRIENSLRSSPKDSQTKPKIDKA